MKEALTVIRFDVEKVDLFLQSLPQTLPNPIGAHGTIQSEFPVQTGRTRSRNIIFLEVNFQLHITHLEMVELAGAILDQRRCRTIE